MSEWHRWPPASRRLHAPAQNRILSANLGAHANQHAGIDSAIILRLDAAQYLHPFDSASAHQVGGAGRSTDTFGVQKQKTRISN
jgi:hypothetical protein